MARELEVWLFAERVGTLALTEGRLNFRYAPDWLALTDAFTLSSSLLLKAEPSACPPLLASCSRTEDAPHPCTWQRGNVRTDVQNRQQSSCRKAF